MQIQSTSSEKQIETENKLLTVIVKEDKEIENWQKPFIDFVNELIATDSLLHNKLGYMYSDIIKATKDGCLLW